MSTTITSKPRQARKRRPASEATENEVLSIPTERLHRHPDNRTITDESVAALAESLREHGQKEPLRVRSLPDPIGHFEILSGERRYVAGCLAGLDEMRCIIERHDDNAALLELAVANAAREDLDPIERAELLQKLIGSGMDRAAAGRVFGLGSESGVKNALRLLSLPDYFRDLLKSESINVQQARLLIPYPDAFLAAFRDHLQAKKTQGYVRAHFLEDADGTEHALRTFAREYSRPMDKKKHYHGYQIGEHRALFKPDEKQTAALQIVTIPDKSYNAKPGAELTVALNIKLWHSLQDPLAKAAAAKKATATSKGKGKSKAADAEPTAAELKQRRAEQDGQLDRFTAEWIRSALRQQMSTRYEWTDGCVEYSLPWLLGRLEAGRRYGSPDLETLHAWAISQCQPLPTEDLSGAAAFSRQMCLVDLFFPPALWRVALWPVAGEGLPHADLTPPGELPANLPALNAADVDELAAVVGVSVETVWKSAAVDGPARELLRQWLTRHNAGQRGDLRRELKLSTVGLVKRDEAVAQILDAHTPKKLLPLPKRLAKHAK
jgi:ParB/RepB/Spo0J family partition protein